MSARPGSFGSYATRLAVDAGGLVSVRNLTRGCEVARHLEVALTVAERMRGLLGRDRLEPDRALWIRPCKSIHTFGMRFPIDAAFLDSEGRVVRVYRDLPPSRITRILWRAVGVLELSAGVLDATGTRIGDVLDLGSWLSCDAELPDRRAARASVPCLNPSIGRMSSPYDPTRNPEEFARSRGASVEVLRFLPFSLDRSPRVPVYPSPFGLVGRPNR